MLRGLPAPRRVALGLVAGERLGRHSRVLGQRPDRGVAGAGHQHRRPGAVLGVVGQRGVPELVQGRAAGGLREQRLGLLVAEPGAAVLVQVGRGELHPGLPLGHEHRAGLAAFEQARQQPGGAGLPDDDVDGAALAADPARAVRQVQVLDVEREHLGRPGGGLVQHPPERPLAQADVLAGEQLVDLAAGQGAGAVGPRLAALEHPGRVGGEPALPLPVRRGGPDGIEGDVPRGRRPVGPLRGRTTRRTAPASISSGAVSAPNSATTQRSIRP